MVNTTLNPPTFEDLPAFKSLEELNTKGKRDAIYFNGDKKEFVIVKKSNTFLEILKTIFLVYVFKYNIHGYSQDENIVYRGLDNLVTNLPTLLKRAKSDEKQKKLKETLKKTQSVFKEMLKKLGKDQKDIDAAAIKVLEGKITSLLNNFSQPQNNDREKPEPVSAEPHSVPMSSNESQANQQNIKGVQQLATPQKEVKPKLPPLETYEIPEIKVANKNLGQYLLAQTKKQKREDFLEPLQENYQKFIEARDGLIRLNEELKKVAAPLNLKEPKIANDGTGLPPPPPPNGNIPPPPPPPPGSNSNQGGIMKLQRRPTFREKQLIEVRNYKESPTVDVNDQIVELEEKRDTAIEEIKNTLFPDISGLSFTTEKEVEALKKYVDKYENKAKEEIKTLKEVIEHEHHSRRVKRDVESGHTNAENVVDQPKQSNVVIELKQMVKNISELRKTKTKEQEKGKNYTLDMKQKKKSRSELSDKMTLKRLSDSYPTSEKQKDVNEFKKLKAEVESKEKDINTTKERVNKLKNKIDGIKNRLAKKKGVDMDPNSSVDDVVRKAEEVIARC